jgi:metal-responsive CopG/Arc/MetJ family transcriptional regulator
MKEAKVVISVSMKRSLLAKIEHNIEGKSRSEKLSKCAEMGYRKLTLTEGI